MMTNRLNQSETGRAPRALPRLALGVALASLVGLTACDLGGILDVRDPDVVSPDVMQGEAALPAVHAHALTEFAVAYGANPGPPAGQQPRAGQILLSGMLADEFIHTGTFDTREALDRRIAIPTNPHVQETFLDLHKARAAAERAAELFGQFAPNTARHAEMQSLAGYANVMFAENYCSGVPFSTLHQDGTLEFGTPLTTTQTFTRALNAFDGALAAATAAGSATQQNLARLGRGRALLGLGQYEEAAAAAAAVPTSFQYVLEHSEASSRQNNGVWVFNNNQGRWSIADNEGGNGLSYRSDGDVDGAVRDPRIPTVHIGNAFRGALRPNEHWGQLKYPTRSSPTTLAEGVEARLIEAEAALRRGAGGVAQFISIHDALRATVELSPLDPIAVGAMTQRQREDLHFQERAYWLWLTSRRLGDLRRLMWDYGRQQSEIFPVGTHHRGGAYGTDTNFPIAFDEQNNPLIEEVQCITRDDSLGRN